MMFKNKLLLVTLIFAASCTLKEQEPKRIQVLSGDGEIEVLSGPVKQINEEYVNNTNPGQDYNIINISKQGEVTKIITGFHGMTWLNNYVTKKGVNGRKLEAIGYFRFSEQKKSPYPFFDYKEMAATEKIRADTSKHITEIYIYNKRGEIVSYVTGLNRPPVDSSTYKYNSEGELIESDQNIYANKHTDITKYTYDGFGRVAKKRM